MDPFKHDVEVCASKVPGMLSRPIIILTPGHPGPNPLGGLKTSALEKKRE
jgi:hypothetical protein